MLFNGPSGTCTGGGGLPAMFPTTLHALVVVMIFLALPHILATAIVTWIVWWCVVVAAVLVVEVVMMAALVGVGLVALAHILELHFATCTVWWLWWPVVVLVKYVYVGIVFTCSTLHLFLYPVSAGDQRSVQHLTLRGAPVDVLKKLLSFFSEVTELMCHAIRPPQEVQCVHMYSVA